MFLFVHIVDVYNKSDLILSYLNNIDDNTNSGKDQSQADLCPFRPAFNAPIQLIFDINFFI